MGQLVFVWNIVTSWLEGPKVQDGDPWDLQATDQYPREFAWFEREKLPAVPGGGETEPVDGEKSQ